MKNGIIICLPGEIKLGTTLANKLKIEMGAIEIRDFPDGESYVRIKSDVQDKFVFLIGGIDHPNNKILSLIFIAKTIKELGAHKICLISPYLPYMRQDKRFNPGEAITSIIFAKFISSGIDCLITVDPHLHRIHNLSEIYPLDSISVLHATKKISEWITENVKSPFIVGPDEESQQWVKEVAELTEAPFVIIKKIRYGDRKIEISIPEIKDKNKTLILVDDIISTGTTMLAVIQTLISRGFTDPICIGVHALFDDKAYNNLLQAGAKQVVTCNTILHLSNGIDITNLIEEEIKKYIF